MTVEADNAGSVFDFGDNLDAEAVFLARLRERRRRAGSALAEVKVPADDDCPDPEPGDQNLRYELLRAHARKGGVKRKEDKPCQSEPGATAALSRGGVSRNTTGRPLKKSAGWGSNVSMALGAALSLAMATARSMTARCPRCRPSKLPIA